MASLAARLSKRALKPATTLSRNFSTAAVATATATASSSSSPPSQSTIGTKATLTSSSSDPRVKWDYRGQRRIIPLGQWIPKIAVDAYVAPNVVLAGQVTVSDGSSVWNGSVLRGDLNKITIGFCSNVQERSVLHAAWASPTGFYLHFFYWIVKFSQE
ncbi:hypothetical protein AQUCO_01100119v1 [Aquilegia coerulea]|uniref:Gamma carbonic anhydrase-like 2, mitochondrial n=1 Tax=Aquilegia coerulea TaxID=218851 RepID=A0A2G5E5L9_AQUCA|nr:hypothetical protein AQUCO_01100119v1 [Aquilegia coerulea]